MSQPRGPPHNDASTQATGDVADKILATAHELVPVVTGTLKESLFVKRRGKFAYVGASAKTAPHGHLVEYGTVHSRPNPFLEQAKERHQDELKTMLEQYLKEKQNGD